MPAWFSDSELFPGWNLNCLWAQVPSPGKVLGSKALGALDRTVAGCDLYDCIGRLGLGVPGRCGALLALLELSETGWLSALPTLWPVSKLLERPFFSQGAGLACCFPDSP